MASIDDDAVDRVEGEPSRTERDDGNYQEYAGIDTSGAGAGADTGNDTGTDTAIRIELSEQPRKRRGRQPKSDTGNSSKSKPSLAVTDRKKFSRQLVGVHQAAALLFRNPLIAITDDEGTALGNALMDVLELHSVKVSPTMLAYLNLAGVSAMIYGPKIAVSIAVSNQKKAAKASSGIEQAAQGAPVVATEVKTTGNDKFKRLRMVDGMPVV